jgi:hypothetical protein
MRYPRMTTRRWMIVTTVVAVSLWGGPTPPTPLTAVARAASMSPAPPHTPRAVARPISATTQAGDAASKKTAEDARGQAVARLVEQLRKHPARPSAGKAQIGLYLIDVTGKGATLVANEPAPQLDQCGSPSWSHDGRRIVFDATPGIEVGRADFSRSHLWSLELDGGRLATNDLGPGNCPDFSPADDRIVFLLNPGGVPGAQAGVWLMQSDGSGRRSLGDYGRPKWSPESRQFLIASFSTPTEVTIMDVRPERSGVLNIPDHKIFSVPNWAGEGTLVAVIGAGSGDAIALIDVKDPAQGKVKEVLWKRGKELDVQPFNPVYSPVSRQCVFVGKAEGKGRALYSFHHGKPDRPARLEPGEQFDNLIQDPAFSPDGRYIVFSGDRKPAPAPPPAAAPRP